MSFARISTNSSSIRAMEDLRSARNMYEKLQSQIVSGKQVAAPKEDPVAYQQILDYSNRIDRNDQYQRNIDFSVGQIEFATSTLDTIADVLNDIRTQALSLDSSLATSADRTAASQNVDALLEEVLNLANTKYLGKFIFGGTETLSGTGSTPRPFNATENGSGQITAVSQNARGIDDLIYREMREGTEIAVNIAGSAAFQPSGEGASDDVFQIIMNLRDGLSTNDTDAITAALNGLDDAIDTIYDQEVVLANRQRQIETIRDQLDQKNIANKEQRSRIEDIDYSELLIELNTAQTVLQASLQSSSQLLQLSLVNFL